MTLVLKETLSPSHLIQRLLKPRDHWYHLDTIYPEGYPDQMMFTLHQAFDFDYMDSPRFRSVPIPRALQFLATKIKLGQIVTGQTCFVYYICPTSYESQVRTVINRLLFYEKSFGLEKPCGLHEYFLTDIIIPTQAVGWLELDNGFMFFADLDMFESTKKLFEIK